MHSRLFRALCPRTIRTLPLPISSRFANNATTASLALPPSGAAATRTVTRALNLNAVAPRFGIYFDVQRHTASLIPARQSGYCY